MASKSLMLEQAQAFAEELSGLPYMRDVKIVETTGYPTVRAGFPRDAYNDVQSLAYKFGMEPMGKHGVHKYEFRAGDVESAERGPARRL